MADLGTGDDESPTATASTEDDAVAMVMSTADEVVAEGASTMDEAALMCVICFRRPDEPSVASLDGCSHRFCFGYIADWAGTRNACPLCQAPFETISSVDGAATDVGGDSTFAENRRCIAAMENIEKSLSLYERRLCAALRSGFLVLRSIDDEDRARELMAGLVPIPRDLFASFDEKINDMRRIMTRMVTETSDMERKWLHRINESTNLVSKRLDRMREITEALRSFGREPSSELYK